MAAFTTANQNIFISGTTTTASWQPVHSINFDESYKFKAQKYWWKFTHYECPLCGSVDTVRERINVSDQAKPEDPDERRTDVVIACGYHFT